MAELNQKVITTLNDMGVKIQGQVKDYIILQNDNNSNLVLLTGGKKYFKIHTFKREEGTKIVDKDKSKFVIHTVYKQRVNNVNKLKVVADIAQIISAKDNSKLNIRKEHLEDFFMSTLIFSKSLFISNILNNIDLKELEISFTDRFRFSEGRNIVDIEINKYNFKMELQIDNFINGRKFINTDMLNIGLNLSSDLKIFVNQSAIEDINKLLQYLKDYQSQYPTTKK